MEKIEQIDDIKGLNKESIDELLDDEEEDELEPQTFEKGPTVIVRYQQPRKKSKTKMIDTSKG